MYNQLHAAYRHNPQQRNTIKFSCYNGYGKYRQAGRAFTSRHSMALKYPWSYKEQFMHTWISILFSAVFMMVTGTGSFAQDTSSDNDANEQSPVCFTHMISDATGDCRNAFMQAFGTLSRKCGNNDQTINDVSLRHLNEYMSACGCSSECRR
jgi:hypothetical protein